MEEVELQIKSCEFTADVEKKFLFNLIENSLKKVGCTTKLCDFLIKEYNITRYEKKDLASNIRKWQKHLTKHQIPLDVFLSLCVFSGLAYNINGIRLKNCRTNLMLPYPIKVNSSFVFVSECVRVEGHLTKKSIVFENTNTELTNKLKNALLDVGIDKSQIKETLHIRIQVPFDLKKDEVNIRNLSRNKTIDNFHERILDLVSGTKKEFVFTEQGFDYSKKLTYCLFYKDRFILVNLKIPRNDKIRGYSTLKDKRYQSVSPSLRLDVHNTTLSYLLHHHFEIPYGNKSRVIRIPLMIKNCDKGILKEAVGGVVAAEANLKSNNRIITLCSLSNLYLNDFQEILSKFGIESRVNKNMLRISGVENFRKMKENFDLVIRSKNSELDRLTHVKVEQSQKGRAKLLYLRTLNDLGQATFVQIRDNANKKGNSPRLYVNELLHTGCLKLLRSRRPKIYAVTEKGKSLLNSNKTSVLYG